VGAIGAADLKRRDRGSSSISGSVSSSSKKYPAFNHETGTDIVAPLTAHIVNQRLLVCKEKTNRKF
jgi:hypothetical protein